MNPDDPIGWLGVFVFIGLLFTGIAVLSVLAYLTDRRERSAHRDNGSPANR